MKRQFAWKKTSLAMGLALGLLSGQALAADPVLSLSATPDPAQLGSVLDVDVLISGVADLYGYQFSLNFDPTIFQAASVSQGSFLSSGGSTFGDVGIVDNGSGSVSFVFNTLVGAVPGVNGNGQLARLSFNVIARGNSTLQFSDVLLADSNANAINVNVQSLNVQVVPEPASALLLGLGLAGLVATAKRRRNADAQA
ncbi:cohesin domain-containing protein [Paucibacter sp. APW11]|uniref:Cohesin domain-containing protein n=1 Tax=Roseateles aquae TaxID=3077235 RepID=A0ABU3PC53_9BURK|nr:cohesin domain-containing protein [Paucibacter sp. APW11]MDT8999728.1 cohesin domain-containing protein [Paucibacter sp. APW11]